MAVHSACQPLNLRLSSMFVFYGKAICDRADPNATKAPHQPSAFPSAEMGRVT
jgi:hypothetical protein